MTGPADTAVDVRPAAARDAAAIADVYAEGISTRNATFVTEPPSPETVGAWIRQRGPFLVAERGGEVVGWAALSEYGEIPAYRGVGEFAIYVGDRARRTGVGRALLNALCEAAEREGRHKIVGKIFPENEGSMALCRTCGFRLVGVHERHGRLEGRWRDVAVLERLLGPAADDL